MAIELVIRGNNQASPVLQDVAADVTKLGDTAERQGGRMRGFFSALRTGILGAGAGIAVGLGVVAGAGLTMNNSMEQASTRIQAFTKDAGATADILDMVRTRAANTPFAFNEMATAAANLLPAAKASGKGLEDLIAQAEILAASNPAEGLEGAAFALKEALSGDFTSIVERFNLPRQRLMELKEQGVPALEAVQIAMQELGLDAELVTGLAGTAQGRWSTFMDTLQGLAAMVTQPIFDGLSQGLVAVQGHLDANMPMLQAMAVAIAGGIGDALRVVVPLVLGFVLGIGDGIAVLQGLATMIQANAMPILAGLGTVLIGFAPIIYAAVIPPFLAWASAAIASAAATALALAPVVIPIVAIGAAVGLLVAAWQRDWGGIRTSLTTFWEATGRPIFEQLQQWVQTRLVAASAALSAFWQGTLQPALVAVGQWIQTTGVPMFQNFLRGVEAVTTGAASLAAMISGVLTSAITGAQATIGAVAGWFGDIAGAVERAIGWLQRFLDKLASIQVPAWLQGHSPPPMADWFTYIGDAARTARESIASLQAPMDAIRAPRGGISLGDTLGLPMPPMSGGGKGTLAGEWQTARPSGAPPATHVTLTMSGGLERLIDARVNDRLEATALRAGGRKLTLGGLT